MRKGESVRKTDEVEVNVELNLDLPGYEVDTGIPFFNHMLESFSKHSGIGLRLHARGDLEVDEHHTVEDTAITFGEAIRRALGDKKGIRRFGDAIIPMDESVAICAVDISGRGVFNFDGKLKGMIDFKAENFYHFFDTLCRNSGLNVYLSLKGKNPHHMMEAGFKAFGVALGKAIKIVNEEIKSTKGILD
ncbi:MAG TPA: imidazoleglycerol-phosphate dehydratase HisB [Archaeoglobaceae archaeon]|nr:imidazoleglycerol-phosphate dehydratase HisB [Archaeoglobaceae archaeon]